MGEFSKYSTPVRYDRSLGKPGPDAQPKKEYPPLDWGRVDVAAQIERHTSTRLNKKGNTQLVGACPFDDCSVDEDGFICWPNMSKQRQHFYCRGCRRSGDLINLLRDLKGWDFQRTLVEIGMRDEDGCDTSAAAYPSYVGQGKTQAEQWMEPQLELLRGYYPEMQKALVTFDLPKQYLASRGIGLDDALRYGMGYFPLPGESGHKIDDSLLTGWFGRIVFPLSSQNNKGVTFAGRTLRLWKSGMVPADHKHAIEAYNEAHPSMQILRVRKTSPCGYFGYAEAVTHSQIVVCEGEFDALALMIAGIDNVIAMGTSLPARLIPMRVQTVTLALDADPAGQDAIKRLALDLADKGIEVRTVVPPIGKDWNDSYMLAGQRAIVEAFRVQPESERQKTEPQPLVTPLSIEDALVDERMPDAFKTNTCYRCGRYGKAAWNPSIEMWACICSQLEDFETARSGKAARMAALTAMEGSH